jgi:hypothetical protein
MPAINSRSHFTGQGPLTTWTPEKVATAPDPNLAFALYAQQVLGVPFATVKDLVALRTRVADVFNRCPQANYYTLCRVVRWATRKRIRRARVYQIIDLVPEAWADRALPELDEPVRDEGIEQRIADALNVENDPSWRRRLIGAMGTTSRSRVLNDWMLSRA